MTRALLGFGVAAPLLYFTTMIATSLTWPGYSHATQYVSELGSAAAPHPWLFNAGIVATGILGLLAGVGISRFFARERRPWSGGLAGVALGAWGVGMIFGGLYPMPDPRHNGFGLTLGVTLLPLLLAIALRGRAGRGLNLLLLTWLVATAVLLTILFGLGGLVTRANVGLWQRALAVAMIPAIGIACAALRRRSGRPGPA
jgi:hypothetical membrane protein